MTAICLNSADQKVFLTHLQRAVKTGQSIVFLNHQWGDYERAQVAEILKEKSFLGEGGEAGRGSFSYVTSGEPTPSPSQEGSFSDRGKQSIDSQALFHSENNEICTIELSKIPAIHEPIYLIPTGGTSGKIKFAVHNVATLSASVAGFREFFDVDQVNSFCVLPLYHVGGLMQWWRSHLSGGRFILGDYGALKQGIVPEEDLGDFCLSLVPTQLQVLLRVCPDWLRQFRLVLIGGAPTHGDLLDRARKAKIQIGLTYGMTETASQIVALKPQDFLAGKGGVGQVLPHAQIQISGEGIIEIQARSLFWGYYPHLAQPSRLITDDVGYFDGEQYLHLLGRNSHKIISGGENIYPTDIEHGLLATGLVEDVAVVGQRDDYWGERVVAVVVLKPPVALEQLQGAIANQFSRYQMPKQWVCVAQLPRNAQGKLNQTILREMIGNDYR